MSISADVSPRLLFIIQQVTKNVYPVHGLLAVEADVQKPSKVGDSRVSVSFGARFPFKKVGATSSADTLLEPGTEFRIF